MTVYNNLDFDGRVQRSILALYNDFDIDLLSIGQCHFNIQGLKVISLAPKKGMMGQFLFWMSILRQVFKREKYQWVYAHDFFSVFPCLLFKIMTNTKIVYDAHELLIPDSQEKTSRREKVWLFLEKISINFCDLIISANEKRADIMKMYYHLKKVPLVINNISIIEKNNDIKFFPEERFPEMKCIPKNHLKIIYQGNIDQDRDLLPFILAMENVQDAVLILVGDGPGLLFFKKICESKNIKNVIFLGRVLRNELPAIMSFGDVGLITYSMKGLNNQFCAPNKIFEYTQSGLVVLTSGQDYLVEQTNKFNMGQSVMVHFPEPFSKIQAAIENLKLKLPIYQDGAQKFSKCHSFEVEAIKLRCAIFQGS